jgi:tetratricopeptide (TPR) repeat protein
MRSRKLSQGMIVSSIYLDPPSDPQVASIVAVLHSSLEHIPSFITHFKNELQQGKTLAACRGITEDELEELYGIAEELCDQQKFLYALPIGLHLALHHPQDVRFQFIAGTCLQKLGQYQAAITAFDQACQLDPQDAVAFYRLGECLFAAGMTRQALEQFDKAVALTRGDFNLRTIQDQAESRIQLINQP